MERPDTASPTTLQARSNPKSAKPEFTPSFFTIGRKITLTQVGLVFLAMAVAGFSFFNSMRRELEVLLGERLESIARTATLVLPGESHETLVQRFLTEGPEGALKSPEFTALTSALKSVQKNNLLRSDVYTLIDVERALHLYPPADQAKLKGQMMFIAMATQKEPYIGHLMPMHPKARQALEKNQFTRSELYTDGEGTWVSAFAPIRTRDGRAVAVVEFDYNAKQEVAAQNRKLLLLLLAPASFGIALALLLGAAIGRGLTGPIRTLSEIAELVSRGNFDVRADVVTRDETGAMSLIFNQMVEDLKRQRSELRASAKDLQRRVEERTLALAEAQRSIQSMVDSVGQAFFLFDRSGNCASIHSQACERILGASPAGQPLAHVLRVPEARRTQFAEWCNLLFDEPIPFEGVVALGPQTLEAEAGFHDESYVTLEYFPIRGATGQVERVVGLATDRTREHQAELRAERERSRSQQIIKLLQHRDQVAEMIQEASWVIRHLNECLRGSKPELAQALRLLHSLKGIVGFFELTGMHQAISQCEEAFSPLRASPEASIRDAERTTLQSLVTRLETEFDRFLGESALLIGIASQGEGPGTELLTRDFQKLLVLAEAGGAQAKQEVHALRRQYLFRPLSHLFLAQEGVLNQTARLTQKRLAPLLIEGGDTRVAMEPLQALSASFVHLFRNAVDHGIEFPADREAKGKMAEGQIRIQIETRGNEAHIEISDDGGGISPETLRRKFAVLYPDETAPESDEELLQIILRPGFSTRTSVTDFSGRGVGLDAVAHELQKLGGTIRVASTLGEGTRFTLRFPVES